MQNMIWNFINMCKRALIRLMNGEPVCSIHCKKKILALTFDDGYQYTGEILEKLEKHRIKATFFLVGDWVEQDPELCRKLSEAGHEIGNHSYSHFDLTKLSGSDIPREINRTQQLIKRTVGKECSLFRFPYGAFNKNLINLVKEQGLKSIEWSVDSHDWTGIDAKTICKNVLGSKKLKRGAIVLLHTTHYETVEALDQLIPALKAKEFQLVRVSDLIHA